MRLAAPAKPERPVLANDVHEKLKGLILDQRLSPGMRLNIDKLCRELKVSSSPLREALARLTAERLVRFEPYIGFSVTDMPGAKYYKDLMDLRLSLECEAARGVGEKGMPSNIRQMERALCAMETARARLPDREHLHYGAYRSFHACDERFHLALVASAGNQPLFEAYSGLHVHLHIARLFVVAGGFNTQRPVQDHWRIMNAFLNRDPAEAEEAVRSHLSNIDVMKRWFETE